MIIQSKRVWILEHFMPAQVEIEGDKMVGIYPYDSKSTDLDYGNLRITPGFIDTHCHGAFGFDTNDADEEGLRRWLKDAPKEGITSLCPTTITQSESVLTKALENVAKVYESNHEGAQIVGIHFEGPYLNVKYKGAQPEAHIVPPNLEQFNRFYEASKGLIKIITMATENDPHFEFTKALTKMGIAIHIGHSAATYEEAVMAYANGALGSTHTFNGMSGLTHRQPNLAGAALHLNSMYSELICDGIHVSVPVMNLVYRTKDKDKVILITDALAAKGVGVGHYVFGGQEIDVKESGAAYLSKEGNLAGSTLYYNMGLKNVIEDAQVNLQAAINSATINPARLLKIDDHKGLIKTGYDADLVVLNEDYSIKQTYVLGKAQL